MANNYLFNPSGTSTAASNDIAGVHYPRVKLTSGDAGTANDVGPTNPIDCNIAKVAGTTAVNPSMDNGASGAGVQRVTIASDSSGQVIARGNVASGALDTGNPVKTGSYATTSLTAKTNVSDTMRVDSVARVDGALITSPFCNLEDILDTATTTITASTAEASIVAAIGSGIRAWMTGILISNSSASTFTEVQIKDDSTANTGVVRLTIPVPPAGGAYITFPSAIRFKLNAAIYAVCTVSTTSIKITPIVFKSKI